MLDALADNDYKLWMHLMQTRRAMFKARRRELAQYNISPFHSAVLFYIQLLGEKATPAEISRWLFRESHSVSEILTGLERKGLIKKFKDLERRNMVRLELTERGKEAYRLSSRRESVQRIMSVLSEEQKYKLWEMLKTLRDAALKEMGVSRQQPLHSIQVDDG